MHKPFWKEKEEEKTQYRKKGEEINAGDKLGFIRKVFPNIVQKYCFESLQIELRRITETENSRSCTDRSKFLAHARHNNTKIKRNLFANEIKSFLEPKLFAVSIVIQVLLCYKYKYKHIILACNPRAYTHIHIPVYIWVFSFWGHSKFLYKIFTSNADFSAE